MAIARATTCGVLVTEPAALRCTAMVRWQDSRLIPELARFALLPRHAALDKLGKNLARILREIGP